MIAHIAAWLPFVIGSARLIHAGWWPDGDNAAIALRSWNSLTAHGPLVGQATRLAHGVFDPGPLEYWLLAIPVHISPTTGVLWGAVLCCMAACSLAIEAAWATGGEFAGLTASGLAIGIVMWMPSIAVTPDWNPSLGMIFFLATLATAWAVLAGRRAWWPGLVVAASIAAQAHLMYAVASVALAALTLIIGIIDTVRARAGYRWLVIGALLGAACWSGPFIQQFTSRNGNLSALIANSESGSGARTGVTFAFRALSAAVQPVPLWWRSSLQASALARDIGARSPWFGAAVLILVVLAGAAALGPLRSRRLAALSVVTLVLTLGALFTYSSIPVRATTLLTLIYLIYLMLPIGVLCWLVIGWAIVLTVRRSGQRAGTAGAHAPAVSAGAAGTPVSAGVPAGPPMRNAHTQQNPAPPTAGPPTAGPPTAAQRRPTHPRPAHPRPAHPRPAHPRPAHPRPGPPTAGPPTADLPAAGGQRAGQPPAAGRPAPGNAPPDGSRLSPRWAAAGLAAAAIVAVLALVAAVVQSAAARVAIRDPAEATTKIAAARIERMLPGQRVVLLVEDSDRAHPTAVGRITVSLTWALTPAGFHAEVTKGRLARELGSSYVYRGRPMPLVTVLVRGPHGVTVHVSRSSDLPASLRLANVKHGRDSQPVR